MGTLGEKLDRPQHEGGEQGRYIVTAIADNRPGLLHAIASSIRRAGCAVESVSLASLGTAVSVTLLLRLPDAGETALRAALVGLTVEQNVTLRVDPVPDGALYRPVDGVLREIVLVGGSSDDVSRRTRGPLRTDALIDAAGILGRHGALIMNVTPRADGSAALGVVLPAGVDEATLAAELAVLGGLLV